MSTFWGEHARGRIRQTFVSICAIAFAAISSAQTPSPTAAQVEAFRNMSPDQQRAVLDAVQGDGSQTTVRDPQLTAPVPTEGQQAPPPQVETGPPRMEAGDTVVLDITLRDDLGEVDQRTKQLLETRRDRIREGNPFVLDNEGRLSLPLVAPINLSGLTEAQAAQRLNFDARFAGLHFAVTLLPVEPAGTAALKPFGYDLFEESANTFAPAGDLPVPVDYRVGPGDNVNVELFGKKTGRYQLVVDRNGALNLPEFGPVQVSGLTFEELRDEITSRVAEQMIGVRASVTMGQLRSIRIFVLGDVARPGSYTVPAQATITHALFSGGGVSDIGSLRNVELKRGGQTVGKLDLYDLLLKGDTSGDEPLQQGDAVFVPAVGSTAGVTGQVRRPALYEFRAGDTIADLLYLSGGLTPSADPRLVTLERIGADRERTIANLDLTNPTHRNWALRAGDVLTIPKVFDDTRGVFLEGQVQRPGAYAWHEGMRLTELLGGLHTFNVSSDQRYVLIRREHRPSRRVEVISADATRAFQARATEVDPVLQSGDRVIVFDRQAERGSALDEVVKELRMQARDNAPAPIVTISGRVRAAGDYPLQSAMTVDDLIRAGGGLDDAAYATKAELTRYQVANGEARKTEVVEIDLKTAAEGAGLSTPLRAYDVLLVKETPDWREQESITLQGEVRFPGKYPIRKDETLSSVVARAGGLTDRAFPQGSVFMRQEIKDQERQQLQTLANRLQSDLTFAAVRNAQSQKEHSAEMLAAGESMLAQLRNAQPMGRLVIDVQSALRQKGSDDDIRVVGGDELVIPRLKPYVTVIGEVQNSTSHVWKRGLDRDEYLRMSGGTTARADKKRAYVVRANGSVVSNSGSAWFDSGASIDLQPGDTIVVPVDAERMSPLPLWTAVTTIVYNLAVAVAAIGSL